LSTPVFFLVLFAAAVHASWNFFAKSSSADKVSLLGLGLLFSGGLFAPFSLYLLFKDGVFELGLFYSEEGLGILSLFVLSSIVTATHTILLGSSYSKGEISTIYPIVRGTGIAVTTLVASLLGIAVPSLYGFIGIAAILLGVLAMAFQSKSYGANEPGKLDLRSCFNTKGTRLAALAGVFTALYSIVDSIAVQRFSPFSYITIVFFLSGAIIILWSLYRSRPETSETFGKHKLEALLIGLATLGTYTMILWAFRYSPVSYVVALRETSILFATLLGVVKLRECFHLHKAIGVGFILLGAVIVKFA